MASDDLREDRVDYFITKLGLHPLMVYPDEWTNAPDWDAHVKHVER